MQCPSTLLATAAGLKFFTSECLFLFYTWPNQAIKNTLSLFYFNLVCPTSNRTLDLHRNNLLFYIRQVLQVWRDSGKDELGRFCPTWPNIVCAASKSITRHKKSLHLSTILQLDKTKFFLKHPGVKSRGPELYVFVEIKRALPDKIFKGLVSRNNEASIVSVIILVWVKNFCSLKSEQMPEC